MVRVTPEQLSLLQRNTDGKPGPPGKPGAPRVKKRVQDLPENQLEAQIVGILQSLGWICTKQHAGVMWRLFKGKPAGAFTIGEKGQADWRAERPILPPGMRPGKGTAFDAELFYFETKAPGERPKPHQTNWLERRQLVGITAVWFNSLAGFKAWYFGRYGLRGGDAPLRDKGIWPAAGSSDTASTRQER